MADRRMLAKSIIESDAFSDMPLEAQMLYVRLNLAADDDGFVSNPRTIMRGCGAGDDSMKLLITKKFILTFQKGDNFIYLIKHWRIHNYIQKDRYKASTFRELLRGVYYDENKAYSLNPGEGKTPVLPLQDTKCIQDVSNTDTERIQDVSEMDTQVRLGKSKDRVSLGEDRSEEGKRECEGENPLWPNLSPEKRKGLVKEWKHRIDFHKETRLTVDWLYRQAWDRYGISKEEIDNFKEDADNDQT